MKRTLLSGLIILLPLVLTIAIIAFIIQLLTKPFIGIVSRLLNQFQLLDNGFLFLSREKLIYYGSELLILCFIFLIILIFGFFARWFFVHTMLHYIDKLINRLPIIKNIYSSIKEIITQFLGTQKHTFKQVVMVPFPGKGIHVIGFKSNKAPKSFDRATNSSSLTSIFVPTTPNPTTGYLLLYKDEDIIELPITPEEAIKYVVSCGIVNNFE